mgnify:CR=1 FL=1
MIEKFKCISWKLKAIVCSSISRGESLIAFLAFVSSSATLGCFVEGMVNDISFASESRIEAIGIETNDVLGSGFLIHTCLFTQYALKTKDRVELLETVLWTNNS